MDIPRFPIGEFNPPDSPSLVDIKRSIEQIAACPRALRAAVAGLSDAQLDSEYRDGSWTVRQVVHHVADSHMHAYIRCKLAVTANHPRINAYEQDDWVKFDDSVGPVEVSLRILDALHDRWVTFLRSLPESAFARTLDHPENGTMSLATVVFLYDWHGRHHTATITSHRKRKGWA